MLSSQTLAFEIAILCSWFVFLYVQQQVLNLLLQRDFITCFTARKISHLAVGFWVVPLAVYLRTWYLAAIPITIILAANAQANSQRVDLSRLERRIFPLVGFLLPVVLILYLWRDGQSVLVVVAVLGMTVGDTVAAYAGSRFGRNKIPGRSGKSIEGAIANFIATLLVLSAVGHVFYGMPFAALSFAAALAAILEAVLPGQWDNPLTIVGLLVSLKVSLIVL